MTEWCDVGTQQEVERADPLVGHRVAGKSIEAVSAFLDHSSRAVTTVYLRRLEGETDHTWPEVAACDQGVTGSCLDRTPPATFIRSGEFALSLPARRIFGTGRARHCG